jgi:hypothetical protein
MFAGGDWHSRLLDPFAGIGGLGSNTCHIALFFDGLGNVGDGFVVQAEKKRQLWF